MRLEGKSTIVTGANGGIGRAVARRFLNEGANITLVDLDKNQLKVHLSTIFLQVPRHGELVNGYKEEIVTKLVASNWVRTIGWSARAGIAVAIVA